MKERTQRVQFRDFSTLSAEDRERGERSKVNGKVINIFRVLMNHPKLAREWGRFGAYILSDKQTLTPRDREMAILRIGWLNQSPYEFEQHVRISKGIGISDDEIDRITKGPKAGWNPHDGAILQAADDLFENSHRIGRDLEDVVVALQHRADDGPDFYDRAVQPGVVGAQQPRRTARRFSAGRKKGLAATGWCSLGLRGNTF